MGRETQTETKTRMVGLRSVSGFICIVCGNGNVLMKCVYVPTNHAVAETAHKVVCTPQTSRESRYFMWGDKINDSLLPPLNCRPTAGRRSAGGRKPAAGNKTAGQFQKNLTD